MYDPYPEERMAQFLGVVSGSLARAVQDRLSKLDLWEDSYLEVSMEPMTLPPDMRAACLPMPLL